MQPKIPCVLMRGRTSKGPFFKASDLKDRKFLRAHAPKRGRCHRW
jgi:2-methylaconitate cis-trans-isomerase PrpF